MGCLAVAPIVDGISKKYADRVHFVRINIHNRQSLALQKELGFLGAPELYLIDPGGHVLHNWGESVSATELEQALQAIGQTQ